MNITEHVGQAWEDDLELEDAEEWIARMSDAYRGESLSLEDDGSPEHDD